MSEVGNDCMDHLGTPDEALTHYSHRDMILNKDFNRCGRCGVLFYSFFGFLMHLTKRYDSLQGKDVWSCPIILEPNQGFQAQKISIYL